MRNRQSTLTMALENPIPINKIDKTNTSKTKQFEIDLPPEKSASENYPSLKLLFQEMGFAEKTPEYKACVKIIKAISPKNKTTNNNITDLRSPTEDETMDSIMEIPFVKNNDTKGTQEKDDEQIQDDEEHRRQQ